MIRLRQTSLKLKTKKGFVKHGYRYYVDGKDDWVYLGRLWKMIMKKEKVYIFEAATGKNITGFVSFTAFNQAVRTYLTKYEPDFFYKKVGEDQFLNEADQHFEFQDDLRKFYMKLLRKRTKRVKANSK